MNTKKEAEASPTKTECKDTVNCRIKQTIASLFASGKHMTAAQINQYSGTNDARKYVSDLRRQGMAIADYRLPNSRKVYFIKNIAL